MSTTDEATRYLQALEAGDRSAADRLMPLVYDELRRLAGSLMRQERSGHTLQPTALVNEAYLRLIHQTGVEWKSRAHFFAVASTMIRRVLIDHARGRRRAKRGGDPRWVTLDTAQAPWEEPQIDFLALEDALNELARLNERHARQVELRFFGGLSVQETAHVLGVGETTVESDWRTARAWLRMRLSGI